MHDRVHLKASSPTETKKAHVRRLGNVGYKLYILAASDTRLADVSCSLVSLP